MPQTSFRKSILTLFLAAPIFGAGLVQSVDPPVTVHEWGTFTSVAAPDGKSVAWVPLQGTPDLPCFVHRMGTGNIKYVTMGLVRMETPVDYFYTSAPTKVSVHVDFPSSLITEWYPQAALPNNFSSIDWRDLSLLPGSNPTLPSTKNPSRYFAARATDSSPVRAGDETEKLLFYRGIGNFKVPVQPAVEGNGVRIHIDGAQPIPVAILFENQNGHIGYRVVRNLKDDASVYAPELNATLDGLKSELTSELVRAGLYPKEAAAMVETWHDAWFEPGMRVIYLVPQATTDAVLPMKVTPTPRDLQRVFVGRVEILSPWTDHTIRKAMETNDQKTLAQFDRFLPPFLAQIRYKGGLTESPLATAYFDRLTSQRGAEPAACIQ